MIETVIYYNGFLFDESIAEETNIKVSPFHLEAIILLFLEYLDRHYGYVIEIDIYKEIEDNELITIEDAVTYFDKIIKAYDDNMFSKVFEKNGL
jgi:hypothetical protein